MISSPHSFRNLLSIIVLVLVLASMIVFYAMRRRSANQNLLIASVPVHYIIDRNHATSYAPDWSWIYNREFKDTLNFVAAKKVYRADEALLTFMAQINKSILIQPGIR